jgi:hypothetical protein
MNIDLSWSVFPACVYEHLQGFTGKDSFYDPAFGPGVYVLVHGNGRVHQVYYLGQSSEDVGQRLKSHFNAYAQADPKWYLPTSAEVFGRDVYETFRNGTELMKQEETGFAREERARIGSKIMHNTHCGYAALAGQETGWLLDVEAVLHLALLKQHNLPKAEWLGDKTSVMPRRNLSVSNLYVTSTAQAIISPTLPREIAVRDGVLEVRA